MNKMKHDSEYALNIFDKHKLNMVSKIKIFTKKTDGIFIMAYCMPVKMSLICENIYINYNKALLAFGEINE